MKVQCSSVRARAVPSRRCTAVRAAPPTRASDRASSAHPLAGVAALVLSGMLTVGPSYATGLESLPLPALPSSLGGMSDGTKAKLQAADDAFEQSDTLRRLREQSEANKAKNKKEIQNKYCYRQAELGIGDCGGLNLVPGMTKNGKQKTPEWLQQLLGVKVPEPPTVTLDELMQRDFTKPEQ